ncbi:MAG TPA: leucine-rich repeat domain-containing protein, partial [Trueperaceae bacterium]|nr:leucine-rich repeat domain-containing protein [Trueperaceae bacterium]
LLADNDIVDLSPVAGLTGLVRLDFDLNHVIDLTPVTGLTALEHLAFWDNGPQHYADFEDPSSCRDGVADLTPLTGLVNLRELYMSCNNISSIEPLAGISGLTRLYMISNLVEDLSPISDKAQIQVLRASDNPLEGGQVNLSGLTSLAWASLEYTSLRDSDLATLGALSHLFTLELEGNFLSDFSPVIDNPLFPASNGSGDPQEPNPASPLVSIAFNCLPDVGATQLALEAKGVTVMGGAPFPQRDPEACALASDVINGNALHLQRLAEFRKRVNSR